MAIAKETSAPAPAPSITEQANRAIATAKTGFDPLKPLRYASTFTVGTVEEGLGGLAKWGRKGLKYGAATGILVGIAAPWLLGGAVLTAIGFSLGGFALGALGGGTHGLATGGSRAIGRMHRAEKYAEDLIVRDKIQRKAPPNHADYRHRAAIRKQEAHDKHFQFMERRKEFENDIKTYSPTTTWQDHVTESRNQHHEHGI